MSTSIKLVFLTKVANFLLKLLKLNDTMITIHSKENLNNLFKQRNYQTVDLWRKQRETFTKCFFCNQEVSCRQDNNLPGVVTIHHVNHKQKDIRDLCIKACLGGQVLNTWEEVLEKIRQYHMHNKAVALACVNCRDAYDAGKLPEFESCFKTLPEWEKIITKYTNAR